MTEYLNIPEHDQLRALGTKHFGDDFKQRFDREVPLIDIHFHAQTPRQLREAGHTEELLTSLKVMIGEEPYSKLQKISHKLRP